MLLTNFLTIHLLLNLLLTSLFYFYSVFSSAFLYVFAGRAQNAEAQIEAQAVSRLADFDFVQSADVNEATFSLDGESVFVQNCPKLQPWTKSARRNWLM